MAAYLYCEMLFGSAIFYDLQLVDATTAPEMIFEAAFRETTKNGKSYL